jgi:hypothetical protein
MSYLCLLNSLFSEFYTPSEDLQRLKTQVIPHDPSLPNVLLLGDSISIAYTPFVKDLLKGHANLDRAKGNCGNTDRGIKSLHTWLGKTKWDIIHFNFGLHDLCYRHPDAKVYGNRDKINGTQSISPEDYEKNLEQIVKALKKTGAKLIFANTTKVPEGEAGRIVGDDEKYNRIAAKVMKRHQVSINNLHALTTKFSPEQFTKPGDVHFTPEGSYKIAQQVVKSIQNKLK